MFRNWIAIVFACLLTAGVAGADRIAVVEPAGKGGMTPQEIETLWGMLESSVGGGYEVVSRAALKQVLTEIGFAEGSGITAADASKQSARSGEIKTVKYILVSTVGKLGKRVNLSLSLIDASTGELVPGRKITETVDSLDELGDRLPDLLREIGLTDAKKRGIYAILTPVITAPNPPPYLADTFSAGLEKFLLNRQIRLRGLKTIDPILRRNGIGPLDAAEPAVFARVGELLRVDQLIFIKINRFAVTERSDYIAASKRTIVSRYCDFDGEVRILAAATGEITSVTPFRLTFNLSDAGTVVDANGRIIEDYGKLAIETLVPVIGADVVRSLSLQK